MSSIRLDARVLIAALVLSVARAGAQQYSQAATVAVSLRVLPQASFEGGAPQRFSAVLIWPTALLIATWPIMKPVPSIRLPAYRPWIDCVSQGASVPAITSSSASKVGLAGPTRSVQRPV